MTNNRMGLGFVYSGDRIFVVHEYGLLDITNLVEDVDKTTDGYPFGVCGLNLKVTAMDSGLQNDDD